jgi:peptidyl-prolyl cis-trans isomerase C
MRALLHFLAGGGLLFLVFGVPRPAPHDDAVAPPIVVSAADVARLRDGYQRETGLPATPADEVALIDRALDEELLFREALARGLDRNDRSVHNWLIEQMRVLADDAGTDDDTLYARAVALGLDRHDMVVRRILVQKIRLLAARAGESAVSDAELHDFFAAHADDYQLPARIDLEQVFLRRERGAAAAGPLLIALRDGSSPDTQVSDAFPVPRRLQGQSRPQLEKLFGTAFAAQVLSTTSEAWIGPLESPYGWHLVRVTTRRPGGVAPFESVRGRVLERWREQRRAARLAELLADLRRRQPLQVESAAWQARGTA